MHHFPPVEKRYRLAPQYRPIPGETLYASAGRKAPFFERLDAITHPIRAAEYATCKYRRRNSCGKCRMCKRVVTRDLVWAYLSGVSAEGASSVGFAELCGSTLTVEQVTDAVEFWQGHGLIVRA